MKIAVIGTGYVGLVSGTCFAETGVNVTCVDNNESKVASLKSGKIPIFEPGLDLLFNRNVKEGRLQFTTDIEKAVDEAQIIFLALPTPEGEDGSADLSYVLGVAKTLGKIMKDYKVIVDKSTVPVGTADLVHKAVSENASVEFDVVSNPEFLREGMAVEDFLKPERVVLGVSSERAKHLMEQLYKPFVRQGNPLIFMDERSAEMTKYAANAFLATKISFMNEIANLCELAGADVDMVRKGIGTDSRIGKRFLFPGIGYGGSCFPKDVKALHKTSEDYKYDFQILKSVMDVNKNQRVRFFSMIKEKMGTLSGKKIALWGLSFKPNTDDIREAPALFLIDKFLEQGATVKAYDPEGQENVKKIYGDKIEYGTDMYDTIDGADVLVIATEWNVFRTPDFKELEKRMTGRQIFDGRNLYELEEMVEVPFSYYSIGRKNLLK